MPNSTESLYKGSKLSKIVLFPEDSKIKTFQKLSEVFTSIQVKTCRII